MYHRSDHDSDKYRGHGGGSGPGYFSVNGSSQGSALAGYAGIEGQKKEEKKKEEQWNDQKIREKYAKKDDASGEKRKKDDSDHHKKQQDKAAWEKKGLASLDDAIDAAAKSIEEAIEKEKKAIKVR
jgi:hypothetical protein